VTVTARPINPSATEGLSSGTLTANAAVAQNDLFGSYATGADQGLTQLRTGIGQLVDGLTLLRDGSQQLSDGLAKAAAGSQQLATGVHAADSGGHQLADAFTSPTGAPDLTSGSAALAAGLAQIDAGLAALADPATGLPKAQAGSAALGAGVSAIVAGLGTNSTPGTIRYGLTLSRGGLDAIRVALGGAPPGTPVGTNIYTGVNSVLIPEVDAVTALVTASSATDPEKAAILGIIGTAAPANTVRGTLTSIKFGLSNPTCTPSCGVIQGLDLINFGSTSGLGRVQGGLDAITFGLSHPPLTLGPTDPGGVSQGLTALTAGLTAAVAGVNQLHAGSTAAAAGANQLRDGITLAGAGAAKLAAGLDLLAAGADKLSAGVPAAVAGSNKITTGLAQALSGAQQAGPGTSAISSQGTAPLITKLQDASNNAHLELATIDATGARAGSAPLGADATWLYRLDAVGPSGDNNLGRNVAFGVGGLLLLLLAGAGGFMFGRRGS
jgi:putative membrane protein